MNGLFDRRLTPRCSRFLCFQARASSAQVVVSAARTSRAVEKIPRISYTALLAAAETLVIEKAMSGWHAIAKTIRT
jgi:hypothetical protein